MLRTSLDQKLLSAVVALSLMAACAVQKGNSKTIPSSEMPETSFSTSQIGDTTAKTLKSIESVYTSLELKDCEVVETYEERGGRLLRCNGYQDISLYVKDQGARFDVNAGVPSSKWTTKGLAYNSIGKTVEWRIHDGKPVAIILRYNFMTDGMNPTGWSDLAVTSVGRKGSPGCLIEWVKADAKPSQNKAARQIADRQAENFDCDSAQ
ncbi:hypothetical protein Riv7116_2096 [Rivularia sp. PCC 7116]|uniref:hypothetical protein n=1 Tax=Rivularia sp. PCC 7116 TaxID=373994 RepID=UPI00029F17E4|nr:hypothetical protein [Rivularia sp. PCC 7116]AFY54628.1 hypothetical protein Riv7116_2096 [Rivularia sp. PCC 7116]